jgi:hypothetical protein
MNRQRQEAGRGEGVAKQTNDTFGNAGADGHIPGSKRRQLAWIPVSHSAPCPRSDMDASLMALASDVPRGRPVAESSFGIRCCSYSVRSSVK